ISIVLIDNPFHKSFAIPGGRKLLPVTECGFFIDVVGLANALHLKWLYGFSSLQSGVDFCDDVFLSKGVGLINGNLIVSWGRRVVHETHGGWHLGRRRRSYNLHMRTGGSLDNLNDTV